MSEYYNKLKQLLEVKHSIKEVTLRAEAMKREQQEEEKKLTEKEKQFYIVDRLGLVMLLQKYLHQKRKRRLAENQHELQVLWKYYNNRETFNSEETASPIKVGCSPKKQKNVYDMMEERIEKLKNYQTYYTQNWGIIKNYQFEFGFIEGRFHELLRSMGTREIKYEEIT